MAEPIVEQISQWIQSNLDGVQDPDTTLTINAERPKISGWNVTDYADSDVVIVILTTRTTELSSDSRQETGVWRLYGIIDQDSDSTELDTKMARLSETIRRTLIGGNSNGKACGGIATYIDAPDVDYSIAEGCAVVIVTCEVDYWTDGLDGYTQ